MQGCEWGGRARRGGKGVISPTSLSHVASFRDPGPPALRHSPSGWYVVLLYLLSPTSHQASMAAVKTQGPDIGFDFSNYARNQHLGQRFGNLPKGASTSLSSYLAGIPLWLRPSAVVDPVRRHSELMAVATSTGTTIVGLKFGGGASGEPEGVCLGADTRATAGPIVADKNCEKVRFGFWLVETWRGKVRSRGLQ